MEINTDTLKDVLAFIVGAGGFWAWISARKKEKALIRMTDASTFKIMQETYNIFVKDSALEVGQVREEILMLRKIIEDRDKKCAMCVNSPVKIKRGRRQ